MGHVFGFLSGLSFGLGLILAGMTDPSKVKAFLDLAGAWDPSLALVMGGAIALGVFVFARAARRERSWAGDLMEIPTSRVIDRRLVIGGILFGVGWGIGGFCPGPALVALGSGMAEAGLFVLAMLAGMVLHDRYLVRPC
jgi:uncharacterized membrane protein YedE/YeeE